MRTTLSSERAERAEPRNEPRAALRAEWTKLRTTPGTAWLLLAIVATIVTVSVLTASAITCPGLCGVDTTRISLTGVQAGQAVVAILAVLMIGGEYSTGMLRVTLTAMPRRASMLAAKAAILTGVVTVPATVAVVASLLAGRLILAGNGFPSIALGDATVLRAAGGSVLYLILIALLSLGVATAVRNSAAAVGIVLGLLYVFPIIAQAVSDPDWERHLQQLGPMSAGLAIQATTDLASLPISPWAGLGVLAGWATAALLTGGSLLQFRDA